VKYFTSEWWATGCEDESAFNDYNHYYSSIVHQLPEKLCIFNGEYTLHDSNIKDICSEFLENRVTISLQGWNQEFSEETCYILKFIDVVSFVQSLPKGGSVESELGDLGYVEFELFDIGIEVRMLFVSGAEFTIKFKDFDFENKKV